MIKRVLMNKKFGKKVYSLKKDGKKLTVRKGMLLS